MQTFKQPLSPEEEADCLARYRNGDMEARNLLIEHNLRLVAHIAKKYQSPEYDPADLISIVIIGLIKGVMTFDSEKNSRLATYAARCIENELLMMFRARKKLTREISMNERIGTDQEGRELRLMDILESEPVDVLEKLETQKNIRKMYQDCLRCLHGGNCRSSANDTVCLERRKGRRERLRRSWGSADPMCQG